MELYLLGWFDRRVTAGLVNVSEQQKAARASGRQSAWTMEVQVHFDAAYAALMIRRCKFDMIDDAVIIELLTMAKAASQRSYSPYSHFQVGAAVLAGSGRIYAAPNVENASYGLAVCAERNAIFQAVGAGDREIVALLVYTPTTDVHTPCGACRQVLAEFAKGDVQVVCAANAEVMKHFTVDLLLPERFSL